MIYESNLMEQLAPKYLPISLPEEIKVIRTATIDSARELRFSNGSSLRVGTSMRRSTFQYLHIS